MRAERRRRRSRSARGVRSRKYCCRQCQVDDWKEEDSEQCKPDDEDEPKDCEFYEYKDWLGNIKIGIECK